MVGLTTRTPPTTSPPGGDRSDDEHGPRLFGRKSTREHGAPGRVEQREPALGPRIGPSRGRRRDGVALGDVVEPDAARLDLGRDQRRDRLGLVARRALGDQGGARLEPIEDEQAETDRERADDAGEGQEELQTNAEPRRARADQARGDEGDEEDEEDRAR